MSDMNVPLPTEHFVLGVGEEKIKYKDDLRTTNTGEFTLNKEDHTIGNLLRTELFRDDRVIFAGYLMPHPLINETIVRVRTTDETTPLNVTHDAVKVLMTDVKDMHDQFSKELSRFQRNNYQ